MCIRRIDYRPLIFQTINNVLVKLLKFTPTVGKEIEKLVMRSLLNSFKLPVISVAKNETYYWKKLSSYFRKCDLYTVSKNKQRQLSHRIR